MHLSPHPCVGHLDGASTWSGLESVQDFNFKLGIQTRVQLQALIDSSHSIIWFLLHFAMSIQILGIFLENKVFQKIINTKYIVNESCSPVLIF